MCLQRNALIFLMFGIMIVVILVILVPKNGYLTKERFGVAIAVKHTLACIHINQTLHSNIFFCFNYDLR